MKTTVHHLIFLVLTLFLSIDTGVSYGQEFYSISNGPAYVQQAYFHIGTGETQSLEHSDWDIAFANQGSINVGIFINESVGLTGNPVKLWLASSTDWSETITDLSPFVDSTRIYNPELNWSDGAFNSVKTPGNPFDLGWGLYDPQSHVIEGHRIFVVQLRDGSFKKLMINEFSTGAYRFTYADLDNQHEVSATVAKGGDDPQIFYSLERDETIQLDFEYDLIFTRYATPLIAGPDTLEYVVTGILLADGTEAAVIHGVDPASALEEDYRDQYSSLPTIIGHDWKEYDFNSGTYLIADDRVQFIKTRDGQLYKVILIDFEGSSTGTTTIQVESLGLSSAQNIQHIDLGLRTYPNPATEMIQIEAEPGDYTLRVFNSIGQEISQTDITTPGQLTIPADWTDGMYFIRLQNKDGMESKSIYIAR